MQLEHSVSETSESIVVTITGVPSAAAVDISVLHGQDGSWQLLVENCETGESQLRVPLPCAVDDEQSNCKYRKATQTLIFTAPKADSKAPGSGHAGGATDASSSVAAVAAGGQRKSPSDADLYEEMYGSDMLELPKSLAAAEARQQGPEAGSDGTAHAAAMAAQAAGAPSTSVPPPAAGTAAATTSLASESANSSAGRQGEQENRQSAEAAAGPQSCSSSRQGALDAGSSLQAPSTGTGSTQTALPTSSTTRTSKGTPGAVSAPATAAASKGPAAEAPAGQSAPVQAQASAPQASSVPVPVSTAQPAGSGGVREAEALDCSGLALLLSSASFKAGLHAKAAGGSTKKTAKADKKKTTAMLHEIATRLEARGWVVCDGYVPVDMIIECRKELRVMEPHYTEGEIWVGKDADVGATISRRDVRGDVVLWMDEQALAATSFVKDGAATKCCFRNLQAVLRSIDRLVTGELPQLAPQLTNVRERSEAMMAIYPGAGARFARHIDNTADDGRRLTMLCYLNPHWKKHHGGALRLFPPGEHPVDVFPEGGRIAMFLSKTVAHEVMPTQVPRFSFTLWYYDALERAEAVASAKVAAGGLGKASAAAQQEARNFIRDVLAGGDEVSEEELGALKQRVSRMTLPALNIVAAVVGAPSTQDFVDSMQAMEVYSVAALRSSLAVMGLEHTPNV